MSSPEKQAVRVWGLDILVRHSEANRVLKQALILDFIAKVEE
jgi:hypothetical protein